MNHIEYLEDLLQVEILNTISKGTSFEAYQAILEGKKVHLRQYSNDYYDNRFLREGLALRNLISSEEFVTPKIIEEWPEHQIRAVEWYDFEPGMISSKTIENLFEWMNMQKTQIPYNLEGDLYQHLTNVDNIHPAYRSFLQEHVKNHWDCIKWDEKDKVIVHGDLHLGNLGIWEKKIVIHDWEYASVGSPLYDRAYYEIYHHISPTTPIEWQLLVTTVITHWYAQEDIFSPKDTIYWTDRLGEIASKC